MIEIVVINIVENSLADLRPDLAKQWDYSKNEKAPEEYKIRSGKKVWWICNVCSYNWESIITNRSRNKNNKCPNCNGRVLNEDNNLEAKYPEIAKQWNYEKNKNITPRDVFAVGHAKYWWKCEHGHEWEAVIHNRVRGRGCPHCSASNFSSYSEKALFFYIQNLFPDAISDYREKYRTIVYYDIFIPSIGVVIEYDGHYFHNKEQQKLDDSRKNFTANIMDYDIVRLREKGLEDILFSCNILDCDERRSNLNEKIKETIEVIVNIAIKKGYNIDLDLNDTLINHENDSSKILETLNRIKEDRNILSTHPHLEHFWSSKNGNLSIKSFTHGSNEIVYWACPDCNEEWKSAVTKMASRKVYRICIPCYKNNQLSLAYKLPEIAKLWHPTKNGELTPYDVKTNSKEMIYWINEDGTESYCQVKSKVDLIKFKERKAKLKQETGNIII